MTMTAAEKAKLSGCTKKWVLRDGSVIAQDRFGRKCPSPQDEKPEPKVGILEYTHAMAKFESPEDHQAALMCDHPWPTVRPRRPRFGRKGRFCPECGARWVLFRWTPPRYWSPLEPT